MNKSQNALGHAPILLPRRHPWRVASALLVLSVLALLVISVGSNPNVHWEVVRAFLFDPQVLEGLRNTIALTVLCMFLAVLIGIGIAVMQLSDNAVLSSVARLYVWFFRGVPLLVQLIFWFNLALLWPRLGFSIPSLGLNLSVSTNRLINSFCASVIGLALHEAAYMAEIVRSGLLSVDRGQAEAARSLGMKEASVLRRIILPQAMRIIVPPTGNQFVSLLKATSLVAFIAGGDLMTMVQSIYSQNFMVVPLLIVASIWYLCVTTAAGALQGLLERRLAQAFQNTKKRPFFMWRKRTV
jgi:polar amino acid transport system permease protein